MMTLDLGILGAEPLCSPSGSVSLDFNYRVEKSLFIKIFLGNIYEWTW